MKSIIKVYLIYLFLFGKLSLAQDPEFSQTIRNGLLGNPAFAGSKIETEFIASFRNQWPELEANYKTATAAFHRHFRQLRGGAGISYLYDNAGRGRLLSHEVKIHYSPYIELNNLVVKPGISFGLVNKSVGWDELTFGDMIDPGYGILVPTTTVAPDRSSSRNFLEADAGLLLYHQSFFAGLAMHHIPVSSKSTSATPYKYSVMAGYNVFLGDTAFLFMVTPAIKIIQQEDFRLKMFQLAFRVEYFSAGIGYREQSSVNYFAGIGLGKVSLAYSYEHRFSDTALPGSAHEISITITPEKFKDLSGRKSLQTAAF